jgi:hypothetical protein
MRIIIEIDEAAKPSIQVQGSGEVKSEGAVVMAAAADAGAAPGAAKSAAADSGIDLAVAPDMETSAFDRDTAMSAGAAPGYAGD